MLFVNSLHEALLLREKLLKEYIFHMFLFYVYRDFRIFQKMKFEEFFLKYLFLSTTQYPGTLSTDHFNI